MGQGAPPYRNKITSGMIDFLYRSTRPIVTNCFRLRLRDLRFLCASKTHRRVRIFASSQCRERARRFRIFADQAENAFTKLEDTRVVGGEVCGSTFEMTQCPTIRRAQGHYSGRHVQGTGWARFFFLVLTEGDILNSGTTQHRWAVAMIFDVCIYHRP